MVTLELGAKLAASCLLSGAWRVGLWFAGGGEYHLQTRSALLPAFGAVCSSLPIIQQQAQFLNRSVVALQLIFAITLATAFVGLATFYRYGVFPTQQLLLGAAVAGAGCLPPLWFSSFIKHGPAKQLGVVAWRFTSLPLGVFILQKLEGVERNCFMYAMLACYFVALSLESWHFVREAQNDETNDDSSNQPR